MQIDPWNHKNDIRIGSQEKKLLMKSIDYLRLRSDDISEIGPTLRVYIQSLGNFK